MKEKKRKEKKRKERQNSKERQKEKNDTNERKNDGKLEKGGGQSYYCHQKKRGRGFCHQYHGTVGSVKKEGQLKGQGKKGTHHAEEE